MPEWNEQQYKAIHTKDRNILVSASAGSGKTTVLIARLMDLVMKDHVSIDAICAMTFTEAAANEMKKRLASELQNAYQTCEEKVERAFITKQLTNIQNAHISTIHSFCLSILQDYYYIIGLDVKRIGNVMDNGSMSYYQNKALDAAFAIQYQKNDEDFLTLSQMFSARPENNQTLYTMIKQLATLANSRSDSVQWLHACKQVYQNVHRLEDIQQNILQYFFEYLFVQSKRYEDMLEQVHERYQTLYPQETKKHAIVTEKQRALKELYTHLKKKDYTSFRQTFINITHAIVPTSPDKEDDTYKQLRKEILAFEDHLLAILYSEETLVKDFDLLYTCTTKLVEICHDYRQAYATFKKENDLIDFDDMEHFALEILQANNGEVAALYREQFVTIMVDEFQDSNDVQNTLVTLICRDNNVFRVGDIKQSIYGFRHALPSLMKGLIENKKEHDEVIFLSNNYRSKQMIVDFNNILFQNLMNIEGFSCRYSDADNVETGVAAQKENNVPICFHALDYAQIRATAPVAYNNNFIKADYIASQIIAIKKKEQRSWKDFVVLVRGNARKDPLKVAFDMLNIPYFIDIKYGFYQSNAVQIMLSALTALCNPHDNIAFTSLMLSPLFQRSCQDMADIRLAKKKNESYYQYCHTHPFSTFYLFEELLDKARTTSLCTMLNDLYAMEGYYSEQTSIQEKTNLDLLFEKAADFETSSGGGIDAFLSEVEQIKDAQTAEATPIGAEANVVRVMSIHQSKGLQFPIVFLWSTDKQTAIEFKDFCIIDSELGIAMKAMDLPNRYVRTTIPRIAMEHKKNKEELEEEMRILYVATTRAQQQMHIVDGIASLESYKRPLSMSQVYARKGYTSWILQTYLTKPTSLFTIKEVHHMWENEPQEQASTPYYDIPHYSMDTTSWQFTTASQSKEKKLPTLSIEKQTDGRAYGSAMHKMIELMQNDALSPVEIKTLAASISFPIHESDIQTLQALQQDELYKEALQGTCYYELPFTAQDDDTILHGFIDFASIQDTHIMIVDYKTDALQNDDDFIERYRSQLDTYKKAMQIIYPKHCIDTYIYSLHNRRMIPIV